MFSLFKKHPDNPLANIYVGINDKQKLSIFYLLFLASSGDDNALSDEFNMMNDLCAKLGISQNAAFEYFKRNAGGILDRPDGLIIKNLTNLSIAQKEMLVTLVYSLMRMVPTQKQGKVSEIMAILNPIGISQEMFIDTAKKTNAIMNQVMR